MRPPRLRGRFEDSPRTGFSARTPRCKQPRLRKSYSGRMQIRFGRPEQRYIWFYQERYAWTEWGYWRRRVADAIDPVRVSTNKDAMAMVRMKMIISAPVHRMASERPKTAHCCQ